MSRRYRGGFENVTTPRIKTSNCLVTLKEKSEKIRGGYD